MDFKKMTENLNDEQKEKVMKLKNPEELLAFVQAEGLELSEEQMDAFAGGNVWHNDPCVGYMC